MTQQTVELVRKAASLLREKRFEELDAVLDVLGTRLTQEQEVAGAQPAEQLENVGQAAVKQLADWLAAARTMRTAPLGRSPAAKVSTMLPVLKALNLGNTAALRQPFRTGIVDLTYEVPLGVLGLLSSIPVSTDVVEFVRVTLPVNAAQPVAEGAAKPEITSHTFTLVQENVRTIAAWIGASRASLEDTPQLESLINTYLLYQLGHQLEWQVVNGNGTGTNFTGILNTSGVGTIAVDAADPVIRNLEAIRLARGAIEATGLTPNAVVLNPNDLVQIELLKDAEGQYFWGGPVNAGAPSIWGLRTVVSSVVPAGKAIVADWRYAVIFDRQAGSIAVSDQHADFFVKNMVAILAEMRAGFGVIRPSAFVVVNFRSWS
jgi:HK97 family phage major capsid protein